MAAHPFGGHPTIEQLVGWAEEKACKVQVKVRTNGAGRAFKTLEIQNPEGGRVAIANPDMNERLAPSQVAYVQRRLGVRTPFAATPAPSPEMPILKVEDV